MKCITPTLLLCTMLHQSNTRTTTLSFCWNTFSAHTESISTLNTWTTSRSNTTACTLSWETFPMLLWLIPTTSHTVTALSSVTTSSEMRFSLARWTTAVLACPLSMVITLMTLRLFVAVTTFGTHFLQKSQTKLSTRKSVPNSCTSVAVSTEAKLHPVSATSMVITWSTWPTSGSMMLSPAGLTGVQLKQQLASVHTSTSRLTPCQLWPTPITLSPTERWTS